MLTVLESEPDFKDWITMDCLHAKLYTYANHLSIEVHAPHIIETIEIRLTI